MGAIVVRVKVDRPGWGRPPSMRILLLLFCICVLSVATAEDKSTLDHKVDHPVMHQAQLPVPEGVPVPRLGMQLSRDAEDGFNLHVELRNFQMESPAFMQSAVEDRVRGHAHLYLNGVKLTRLYAQDLHLPGRLFRPGINSLQISINDHDHAVLALDNEPIQATILMDPGREPFQMSHYSSSPIEL